MNQKIQHGAFRPRVVKETLSNGSSHSDFAHDWEICYTPENGLELRYGGEKIATLETIVRCLETQT